MYPGILKIIFFTNLFVELELFIGSQLSIFVFEFINYFV